jgi:hypothetical protein
MLVRVQGVGDYVQELLGLSLEGVVGGCPHHPLTHSRGCRTTTTSTTTTTLQTHTNVGYQRHTPARRSVKCTTEGEHFVCFHVF